MTNEPNSPEHEYLMYVHKISGKDKLDYKKKDEVINLSNFLPEPCSLNQVMRCAESVKSKWGTAITKEVRDFFDNETFGTDEKPLPTDEIVPTKLTCKAKLNSHGGLDKLKARLCFRGDMQ